MNSMKSKENILLQTFYNLQESICTVEIALTSILLRRMFCTQLAENYTGKDYFQLCVHAIYFGKSSEKFPGEKVLIVSQQYSYATNE